jgi:AraC-like DNA-binding protein
VTTAAITPSLLRQWTTKGLSPSDSTDAWQDALQQNYGRWQVTQAVEPGFSAQVRNRDFNGLRVVECVCDPCTGRRVPQLIAQDDAAYIGVQITRSGSERFHLGGDNIAVGSGDLVIWTSDQPTEFTVVEKLHKVSLILPWSDIRDRLPRGAKFSGTVIDSRSGIGAVLFSHVDNLATHLEAFSENDQASVRRATLELLCAAMSYRVDAPPKGLAQRYLKQLQEYILRNLQDEHLSPKSIASANHMSSRYVHMLFAQLGVSVSAWIREQRLQRCREDLQSSRYRDSSVSEIAYTWGFLDSAHFSRIFKQRFGLNPREYRENSRA